MGYARDVPPSNGTSKGDKFAQNEDLESVGIFVHCME